MDWDQDRGESNPPITTPQRHLCESGKKTPPSTKTRTPPPPPKVEARGRREVTAW